MGGRFSRPASKQPPPPHAPGYFFNCKLNDTTIKELRSLRTKTTEAPGARGEDDAYINLTLAPLVHEIARRERACKGTGQRSRPQCPC